MPVIGYVQGDLKTIPNGALLELDPGSGSIRVVDN